MMKKSTPLTPPLPGDLKVFQAKESSRRLCVESFLLFCLEHLSSCQGSHSPLILPLSYVSQSEELLWGFELRPQV